MRYFREVGCIRHSCDPKLCVYVVSPVRYDGCSGNFYDFEGTKAFKMVLDDQKSDAGRP